MRPARHIPSAFRSPHTVCVRPDLQRVQLRLDRELFPKLPVACAAPARELLRKLGVDGLCPGLRSPKRRLPDNRDSRTRRAGHLDRWSCGPLLLPFPRAPCQIRPFSTIPLPTPVPRVNMQSESMLRRLPRPSTYSASTAALDHFPELPVPEGAPSTSEAWESRPNRKVRGMMEPAFG